MQTGSSTTSVVPAPGADSISNRPPRSDTRSRIPTRPSAPLRTSRRVETGAVVLDHGADRARPARDDDADRGRTGVLDDVRQRLLDDPVERRLVLGRQRERRVATLSWIVDPALLATMSGSAARVRAARPKSSSAGGRSSTVSRRTSSSAERDELPDQRERLLRRPSTRAPSARAGSRRAPALFRRAARGPAASARAPGPGASARTASRPTRSDSSSATAARLANACAIRMSASVNRGSAPRLS